MFELCFIEFWEVLAAACCVWIRFDNARSDAGRGKLRGRAFRFAERECDRFASEHRIAIVDNDPIRAGGQFGVERAAERTARRVRRDVRAVSLKECELKNIEDHNLDITFRLRSNVSAEIVGNDNREIVAIVVGFERSDALAVYGHVDIDRHIGTGGDLIRHFVRRCERRPFGPVQPVCSIRAVLPLFRCVQSRL